MATQAPYICARCLRASKLFSRSSIRLFAGAQPQKARQYHIPSTLVALANQQRTRPSTTNLHDITSRRTLSSNPTRSSPPSTVENTSTTSPPPPKSTSAPSTTKTILNPRTDEETNAPMTIEITPRASTRLTQIMKKDKNPALCLRVQVESGGCHGFQYLMSLTNLEKIDEAEDTVFVATNSTSNLSEQQQEQLGSASGALEREMREEGGGQDGLKWRLLASGKPKVVMDEPSLELLKGSKIDFTMELIGSQFVIVDNPRASSSCGCGTSFDVKM